MAETSIQIRTVPNASTAIGWSGQRTVTIDRPQAAGGGGLGYGGGELLLLAVGACYCNNLFYAADERNISINNVEITVNGSWTDEPMVSKGLTISAKVEAQASEAAILDLMAQASCASTVGNTLRNGAPVELVAAEAVPRVTSPTEKAAG